MELEFGLTGRDCTPDRNVVIPEDFSPTGYADSEWTWRVAFSSYLLPPGMAGFESNSPMEWFDPQKAEALLVKSRYFSGGQSAPEIRFLLPSEAGVYSPTMEFLIKSWERLPGVDIFVEGLPAAVYRERIKSGPPGPFVFESHCADYPDPENF